jgi:hypothetical protein
VMFWLYGTMFRGLDEVTVTLADSDTRRTA